MLEQRNGKRIARGMVFALLPLALTYLPTSAQAQAQMVEYAAKFVCGVPQIEARREAVKPGNYATAINIHNPNPDPTQTIQFQKKAVQARPQGSDKLPPSLPQPEMLPSDFALEVDCQNIRDLLGAPPSPAFIKGFVVILSPSELDVVGVYTAEPPVPATGGQINGIALEVVPIAPRFLTTGMPQPGAPKLSGTKRAPNTEKRASPISTSSR